MQESQGGRRVAVTGLGVLTPCGTGSSAFWEGLFSVPADNAERRLHDFDPAPLLSVREARRVDRFAQFAMVAAAQALGDGGMAGAEGFSSSYDAERCGVVIGSGIGGAWTFETQVGVLAERGPRRVSPFTVPMVMPNCGAAMVSMRWGWQGPCETISTACASGTHSIAAGARLIAAGRCDAVLAGGAEACLTPTNIAAFTNVTALSPSGLSRPFDVERDGFCVSEGAGVVLLEELGAARARGVRVYAEIAGVASTADAYHITSPAPAGRGAAACMRLAIADAGLSPVEIVHVNAHGTSTVQNDAAEAAALCTVFGPGAPSVTSIKGVTGHSLAAAGAVEAVSVALSFQHGVLPPTAGTKSVDPALAVDLVLEPRPWTPGPTLSNSFGFGGHNGTLVFIPG